MVQVNDHYHTFLSPTSIDRDWGVYVTAAGYSRTIGPKNAVTETSSDPEPFWNRARARDDFYIVLIWKGKATLTHGQEAPREIDARTCLLIQPGIPLHYRPEPRSKQEVYWVGFNGYYIRNLIREHFDGNDPVLDATGSKEICYLIRRISEETRTKTIGYHQKIAGLVLQILGLLNAS